MASLSDAGVSIVLGILIDFDGPIPIYRQIADEIRRLVAKRELADQSELPSVRELGGRIGVNQNTVAKAYRVLAEEGLVSLRHGSGAVVRIAGGSYRGGDANGGERRLDELVSRWVLAGKTRREIECIFRTALDGYFDGKRLSSEREPR